MTPEWAGHNTPDAPQGVGLSRQLVRAAVLVCSTRQYLPMVVRSVVPSEAPARFNMLDSTLGNLPHQPLLAIHAKIGQMAPSLRAGHRSLV
jgi:hypothetical protein